MLYGRFGTASGVGWSAFAAASIALLVVGACRLSGPPRAQADPALRLHGHNDYLQPVACTRALELGLGSIEADIFLEAGELLVGHERWQLRGYRSLRGMYLEPLREAVATMGNRLRSDGAPLVLLIDIKADGDRVWPVLRAELERYASMLTRFLGDRVVPGAVTVLLSGDRPTAQLAAESERLCAIDGRLADLERVPSPSPTLMPWVSSSWREVSDWTGSDELMTDEVARVRRLVAEALAQGRELRFWSAPDRPAGWAALFDLGVHRISTDRPHDAAEWLRRERAFDGGVGAGGP